jgi:hypothetical protein
VLDGKDERFFLNDGQSDVIPAGKSGSEKYEISSRWQMTASLSRLAADLNLLI